MIKIDKQTVLLGKWPFSLVRYPSFVAPGVKPGDEGIFFNEANTWKIALDS